MTRRHGRKRAGQRRLSRLGAPTAAITGLAVVAGAPRAVLLVAAGAMVWGLVRWPRLEARVFGPRSRSRVPVRAEVWARPVAPSPARGDRLGAEAHRAYARALHAVTGAYLAECEREAGR
jgi:hypothetical protein